MNAVRQRLLLAAAMALLSLSSAQADDQALANLIEHLKRPAETAEPPITLSAVAAREGKELVLKFTLTNISKKTLAFYSYDLPWNNAYSISWVAITSHGQVLPVGYPIHDVFGGSEISVAPQQTLTGTYRLTWMLNRESIPSDSDLAIVWAYTPPTGPVVGNVATAEYRCTGVAVLHTPK
jgi:hypothetical protein